MAGIKASESVGPASGQQISASRGKQFELLVKQVMWVCLHEQVSEVARGCGSNFNAHLNKAQLFVLVLTR